MIRFNEISLFGSSLVDKYEVIPQPKGPRIVDDSHFQPLSEAVKQLSKTSPLDKGVIEGYYDFPDGRDDGRKVAVARLRPEIVELSTELRKQNEEIKKGIRKAQKIAEDNATIQAMISKNKTAVNKTTETRDNNA